MNDLISRQALYRYALNQKDKSVTPNDIMRFPSAYRPTGKMGDRLLKESDVQKIAFQLPYVANSAFFDAVKALPSVNDEGRLYIKIYADDEPSVMVEKFYQICGETQNEEVVKWLKEYFPHEPRREE